MFKKIFCILLIELGEKSSGDPLQVGLMW